MKEKNKETNLINKAKDDTLKRPIEHTNHRLAWFLKRRKTEISNTKNEKEDTTANSVFREYFRSTPINLKL